MDRIGLSRGLKQALESVHRTGGDPDLRAEVPHECLTHLRDQVFEGFQGKRVTSDVARRFEFQTLMEPQWFQRAIRFAIVFLRQLGVPSCKHIDLLARTIDILSESILDGQRWSRHLVPQSGEETTFEEIVSSKLTSCFQAGYFPDAIAHYDLLDEHGLILWNSSTKAWNLTNLGHYAKDLSLFSLLLFLLGVQLTLSQERCHSRYLTPKLLSKLLLAGEKGGPIARRDLPRTLLGFGVFDFEEGGGGRLSAFGLQLLSTSHARRDHLRDLVLLLLETEAHGFGPPDPEQDDGIPNSELLDARMPSFHQARVLAEGGRHLDALKLLYPAIEGLLNTLLEESGVSTARLGGMHKKFEKLRRLGTVTPRLGYWGEIVVSRNKIVHGDIQDGADELCKPLYKLVVEFINRLLRESERVNEPV